MASVTATILFTDLVGSTEQRARLGDVEADLLRRDHDALLAAVVDEQGGTVVKTLGDGMMATFASAADAVAAAAEAQQRIHAHNHRADDDHALTVRMGLAAGDVEVENGDCHGTPVVIAARLCGVAEGGQVLCDDLVRALAGSRSTHVMRPLGEHDLKGIDHPVTTAEVTWTPTLAEAAPLPAALAPMPGELPFAGRDDERDTLATRWKEATTEGRTVVFISGEPGVGKTRLSADLARAAHGEGATVVIGRCDEHVAAPYSPWVELLRHLVAHTSEEVLAGHVERQAGELTRIVPELGRRVDGVPAARELDPETERLALFDGVLDLLASVAGESPLLILLDDAHWADAASLHLLARAVGHLRPEAAVLVLVTYRDTDVDRAHPLSAMLGELLRQPRVDRLVLRGMDPDGVVALLEAAGGNDLDAEGQAFAAALATETEGNPFFLGETLRHLIDTGVLVHEDGRWRGTVTIDEVGIPQGVREVVGRRLSRLSDEANDALRVGAVAGREFDLDVVAQAGDLDEGAVLDALDEALAARLVDEVADTAGRFSFAHALVRSTLVDELSTSRRIRLHRAIGDALEARGRSSAAELAYHFGEAAAIGGAERAVRYGQQAIDEALLASAPEEAVRFADLVLDALEAGEDDPRTRAEVLLKRSEAHAHPGHLEPSHADALAAADLGRALGDAALVGLAGAHYQGFHTVFANPGDPLAVELMREGLAGMDDAPAEQRARVAGSLAYALVLTAGDEPVALAAQAERLAREADAGFTLRRALEAQLWACRGRDHHALRAQAEELVDLSVASGDRQTEYTGLYALEAALLAFGEVPAAREVARKADELPTSLRGYTTTNLATTLALAEGRFAEVPALADEMHDRATVLGETGDAMWVAHHCRAAASTGQLDLAWEWVARSRQTMLPILPDVTLLHLAAGDVEQARAAVAECEELMDLLPPLAEHYSFNERAEAAARLGDAELAARIRPRLDPFEGELIANDPYLVGTVEHALGLLDHAEGKYDDAVPRLEHDVFVMAAHGWRGLEARHRIDLARSLLARDDTGDAELAADHLDVADALATELGMAASTRLIERLRSGQLDG